MDALYKAGTQSEALSKTILVVEDDELMGQFITQALQDEVSYRTLIATDAFRALSIVRNIKPSLFLLDYLLPKMNGIELYDHVQTILKERHIPTIMLTASLSSITPQLQERQIIGMSKPFHITELTSLIAKLAPLDIC